MRFPVGVAVALAVCLTVLNVPPVSAQRPSEAHWYCRSATHLDPVYVTPAWSGTASVTSLTVAFTEFLEKKYGFKSNGECFRVVPSQSTQAEVQTMIDRQHETMERVHKKKIVQTGWTNGMPLTPVGGVQPRVLWAACRLSVSQEGVPVSRRVQLRTYVSDVTQRPASETEVAAAFAEFLGSKYGLKGSSSQCVSTDNEPDAQQALKGFADEAAKYGHELVTTGWKFTPAKSSAAPPAKSAAPSTPTPTPVAAPTRAPIPAPAAPVVAPPATRAPQASAAAVSYAICYGDVDPATKYYSAVFDGTKGDYADWMPAFQKHLEQTYKYRGFVRCTKQPSKEAAEKYRASLIAGARAKVVETGWIYR